MDLYKYHEIWNYIHSEEFLNKTFNVQLKEFENIIIEKLTFCSCGLDSNFIITFMLTFLDKKNIEPKDFWISFHNQIRLKLNQEITHGLL